MESTQADRTLDPLGSVQQLLDEAPARPDRTTDARRCLAEVAESANAAARLDVASCACLLADLLEIAECSSPAAASHDESREILEFAKNAIAPLRAALEDGPDAPLLLLHVEQEAQRRWGDYLGLFEHRGEPRSADSQHEVLVDAPPRMQSPDGRDVTAATDIARQHVELILATLSEQGAEQTIDRATAPRPDVSAPDRGGKPPHADSADVSAAAAPPQRSIIAPPVPGRPDVDGEILIAYLEDARRCLATIEETLLAVETAPDGTEAVRQLCRELHTLKGASGTVGLKDLARYLHDVEEHVVARQAAGLPLDVDPLLKSVDVIRSQIHLLSGEPSKPDSPGSATTPVDRPRPDSRFLSDGTDKLQRGESVRVEASSLDRLMNLLAELLILRNRRDSSVTKLKQLNNELIRCSARLRVLGDAWHGGRHDSHARVQEAPEPSDVASDQLQAPSRPRAALVGEIVNDVAELARSLRELYEPVAEENQAISRLIRQFRQELMDLRRMPVGGLFRRLQRAARDAAHAENRRVHLELVGEHARLERSLQERLHEPLLHMVRNAVSHGIESEKDRLAAGKPAVGTVAIEAHGVPGSLIIEVRDDGRGLDYEAIERRGHELGLISASRTATRAELAQLIFHPGFSTRTDVSTISGRGVGLDVVSAVVDRLHGQIKVDSVAGRGTTITMRIPLRSVIEHAMVFRVSGQLFALPMQYVHAAKTVGQDRECGPAGASGAPPSSSLSSNGEMPAVHLRELLALDPTPAPVQDHVIIVGHGPDAQLTGTADAPDRRGRRVALVVDSVVGPEELVVRSLPGLLRRHRLFAGVTLSGASEIVLLFDGRELVERGRSRCERPTSEQPDVSRPARSKHLARPHALLVDDSLSVRRHTRHALDRLGFAVIEAADGMEALEILRSRPIDLLLTDVEMPRLGGLELLAEINRGRGSRPRAIVVLSDLSEASIPHKAAELGACNCLFKPVSEKALNELLNELKLELGSARPRRDDP